MDWSTSPEVLAAVCDDATVPDAPGHGVRGAAATHVSLRDLGAEGVLLLGTTSNLVLLLGFRRAAGRGEEASWAWEGLPGSRVLAGDSANTQPGRLDEQASFRPK
jgi:hypothetical protein